jgi:hypothetical protein
VGDVCFQAGYADRGCVADEQGQGVARLSPASLASVGPVGHFTGAVSADAQLAVADEGTRSRVTGCERPHRAVFLPVPCPVGVGGPDCLLRRVRRPPAEAARGFLVLTGDVRRDFAVVVRVEDDAVIALLACRSPPRYSRCRSVRPEDTGIGAAPHSRAKDASDRSRSGLSPAVTSSCPAVSTPTLGSASSSGAAVTRGASWVSRSSISACSACQRRARARSAVLTAEAGSATGPGRNAAQARIRCLDVSLRSGAWTGSGAVRISASICAPAWIRPFIAPRRATGMAAATDRTGTRDEPRLLSGHHAAPTGHSSDPGPAGRRIRFQARSR